MAQLSKYINRVRHHNLPASVALARGNVLKILASVNDSTISMKCEKGGYI